MLSFPYLELENILPLHSVLEGTVLKYFLSAICTILSLSSKPNPNFSLTCSPIPFILQSGSLFKGNQFAVCTTIC